MRSRRSARQAEMLLDHLQNIFAGLVLGPPRQDDVGDLAQIVAKREPKSSRLRTSAADSAARRWRRS